MRIGTGAGLKFAELGTMAVYLFVNAPPPMPQHAGGVPKIPVKDMFTILNQENHAVRTLWTKEIVGQGKLVGLKFDEHWKEESVQAGPLPALFLRETARVLEIDPTPLSLFLGSDFPINSANGFAGEQLKAFAAIKKTRAPQFFFNADTTSHVAMFADVASVQPCVDCHNKHVDSPKADWALNDVMGATTWSYPRDVVTAEEIVANIAILRRGFREVYQAYLDETRTFSPPPEIGEHWPIDGYYLPSAEHFMTRIVERNSGATLESVMSAIRPAETAADNNKNDSL